MVVRVRECSRSCHFLCALRSSVQPGLHEQDQVYSPRKRMRERPRMRLRRSSNACKLYIYVGPSETLEVRRKG